MVGALALAAGASTTYGRLLFVLILLGVFYSSVMTLTNRAVALWVPRRARGLAMSVKQSGTSLGSAFTAAVLPSVALAHGWGRGYQLVGLLLLATALVCSYLYRDPTHRDDEGESVSVPTNKAPTDDDPVAGGFLGRRPGAWDIARHPGLLWVAGAGFTLCTFQLTLYTFFIPYLSSLGQASQVVAGLYLGVMQFLSALARPVLGFVSDRFLGARRKALLTLCGLSASILLAAFARLDQVELGSLTFFSAAFGVLPLAWAGLQFVMLTELFHDQVAGTATGFGVVFNMAGSALGPALFGLAVDLSGDFRVAWQGLAALLFVYFVLFWFSPVEASAERRRTVGATG
ncbi:MAG: MFS transporter [Clostridia bacterium]|nr:MFS transporter [Clostridia bacterium]